MKPYLNAFFLLLKIFYNLNKVKINDDKTYLMFLNNPRHEEEVKDTKIITYTDTITPREKILMLGWTVNQRLDYHDHLSKIFQVKFTTGFTEQKK